MGDPLEPKASPTSSISPTRKSEPAPESTKQVPPARLPSPALFQGPPSRDISNVLLHAPGVNAAAIGLPASASATPTTTSTNTTSPEDHTQRVSSRRPPNFTDSKTSYLSASRPVLKGIGSTFSRQPIDPSNAKHENDRVIADAHWVEIQKTLAEAELSAVNRPHIFGDGHAKALEELRKAQLGLAQAWAKSEADEVGSHSAMRDFEGEVEIGTLSRANPVGGTEKDGKIGQGQQQKTPGSAGNNGGGKDGAKSKTLEEETEDDILLARRRREANDRYFEQVNSSVLDVVKKLDEVAGAMKRVEKESRDIWSEDEDGDNGGESESGSFTGSTTGG